MRVQEQDQRIALGHDSSENVAIGSNAGPECMAFLNVFLLSEHCFDTHRKSFISSCQCVRKIDPMAAKLQMCQFASAKANRVSLMKALIRDAKNRKEMATKLNHSSRQAADVHITMPYRLPVGNNQDEVSLCKWTFMHIAGYGHKEFATLEKQANANEMGEKASKYKGNTNKSKNSGRILGFEHLCSFLDQVGEEHGEEYATRFVRNLTEVGMRKDEEGLIELPSWFTKRQLYSQWVYTCGYDLSSATMGLKWSYPKQKDWPLRSDWPTGSPRLPVMSWTSFLQVWSIYYPHMRIRRPCEDVCGECNVYRNLFRYRKRQIDSIDDDEGEEDEGEEDEAEEDEAEVDEAEEDEGKEDEVEKDESKEDEGEKDETGEDEKDEMGEDDDVPSSSRQKSASCSHQRQSNSSPRHVRNIRCTRSYRSVVEAQFELDVLEILEHVTMAIAQREYVREIEEKAMETKALGHEYRYYALIGDYAQNTGVPGFGGEQPGETYYFSPLWAYLFGLCDLSAESKELTGYCYHEGQGKKGMNNVVSLVMKHLHDKDIIKQGRTGKKLSLVFDNCGGQNKNNGVIHLCNYLVELKYFEEVEVVFFIRGHTKNHCDHMFNAMKRTYRKDNVYTFSDLYEAWDVSSDNVTVVPVTANDFFAYDEYLDGLYIPIYDSELKKNHIYSAKVDSPTTISIKKY